MKWGNGRWTKILKHDGYGYYAYLPAIFVYNDLSFSFKDDLKENEIIPNDAQNFRIKIGDNYVNKYFAGTAVAQIPFYMLGHLANYITDNPVDGYSVYYLIFIHIGTIFYALLAQYLMILILRKYGISDTISALVSLLMIFSTNIYIYIINEPTMSHVYSLAFVNIFILGSLLFFEKQSGKYFLAAMFALGMIILIRPVNGLIIFSLPFLSGSIRSFSGSIMSLLKKPLILSLGVLITTIIVCIQPIIYMIQTGSFFVYSYGNESLDLLDPNMIKFMFSYKKGFFVYTPILVISIIGSFFLYKRNKFTFYSYSLFLILVIYVLSSWWNWWYGGSFSSRVMIEYYTFFAIPLALVLSKSKLKKTFLTISIILLLITQVQMYQYIYGYIHWSDMNKERYWNNFLRVDKIINKEKDW